MSIASINDIVVADPSQSLAMIDDVLANKPGPARDIVVLNAGAGIYVSGLAKSLAQGVELASLAIAEGRALAAKDAYISATQAV